MDLIKKNTKIFTGYTRNYFETFLELDTNTSVMKKFIKRQKANVEGHNHRTGECDYHSESGCQVKCYKTPICLGYVCEAYKAHLKEYFKIGLTYSSNALEGNSLTETETKIIMMFLVGGLLQLQMD